MHRCIKARTIPREVQHWPATTHVVRQLIASASQEYSKTIAADKALSIPFVCGPAVAQVLLDLICIAHGSIMGSEDGETGP